MALWAGKYQVMLKTSVIISATGDAISLTPRYDMKSISKVNVY